MKQKATSDTRDIETLLTENELEESVDSVDSVEATAQQVSFSDLQKLPLMWQLQQRAEVSGSVHDGSEEFVKKGVY